MAESDKLLSFTLKVLSPDKKHYEGPAVAVTAENKEGPFDVLAGHVNFFSILSPCEMVINTGKEPITIPISGGIAKVTDDNVLIFVNI